jgi:hypothetical protein
MNTPFSLRGITFCRVSNFSIQKQHWHSREAQIEPPLIECECERAFRRGDRLPQPGTRATRNANSLYTSLNPY